MLYCKVKKMRQIPFTSRDLLWVVPLTSLAAIRLTREVVGMRKGDGEQNGAKYRAGMGK